MRCIKSKEVRTAVRKCCNALGFLNNSMHFVSDLSSRRPLELVQSMDSMLGKNSKEGMHIGFESSLAGETLYTGFVERHTGKKKRVFTRLQSEH